MKLQLQGHEYQYAVEQMLVHHDDQHTGQEESQGISRRLMRSEGEPDVLRIRYQQDEGEEGEHDGEHHRISHLRFSEKV